MHSTGSRWAKMLRVRSTAGRNLFTRARINVDTIPREIPLSPGSRLPADKHLVRIDLYPGPGSDLRPNWLPRELVY